MATAADAIVLSSSPDPPTRTPKCTLNDADRLLETSPLDQTPLSVPSLADVFRPPSRSRFFADASVADKPARKKRQPAKKSDTTDPDATKAPAKPRQRAKKTTKEQEPKSAALGDLETGALDSRDNTAKKAAPSKKAGARTSKKAKETGNMKLTGKVTKASSEPQAKKASKASKESVSQQTPAVGDIDIGQTISLEGNEHLQLEEAMARRRDWTPPRESGPKDVTTMDEETESREAGRFGKLLCDYNYSGLDSDTRDIPLNIDGGGPTKRRRIELVDPGLQALTSSKADQSDSSSGAKSKKKPRTQKRFTTLTARMTAQYTVNETPDDDLMDDVVPDISKAKSRRKTKSTNEEPAFTVLSPEAAVKALDAQDLIFGTCSQLEREESPQTLRDIQRAIRESESLASPASGWSSGRQTPIRSGTRLMGTKNLWGVAARDINGSLVRAAELDSADPTDVSQASKEKQSKSTSLSTAFEDDDWFDLDYGRRAPSKSMTTLQQKIFEPVVDTKQLPVTEVPVAEVPVARAAATTVPVTNVSLPAAQNLKVVKTSQQADIQPLSMPHYPGFTDAELSKQVAVFGFKSIKGRKKMIDLLQKCWESKHGISSKSTEASSQAQTAPLQTTVQSAQPKPKPKAKSKLLASAKSAPIDKPAQAKSRALASPKKTPQKAAGTDTPRSSYIDVDEIQDSEEELFLSPIRVQQRHTEIPPANPPQEHTLDIVTKEAPQSPTKRKTTTKPSRSKATTSSVSKLKSNTAVSSARNSLPDISAQITKAVRLQASLSPHSSSTGSRSCPTWHEKMLMFDPIILEDLTTWLNVEGLGLVEEDREVSSWDVRKWCESKGICCCWKQNASW
ncbi:uncharacterized protein N7503_003209 [Penicillium pulvis]|uniref:uncharacterized protein n=1 Tax=Penicillium pulvis TaxID=1562058 RepID=UPI0025492414|nr:uncharacterized protein N7503_003209 [Penicillium pulvis]KAJ5805607.1 hypothetical protein N7503_003209 [Penicillium pulvis]